MVWGWETGSLQREGLENPYIHQAIEGIPTNYLPDKIHVRLSIPSMELWELEMLAQAGKA